MNKCFKVVPLVLASVAMLAGCGSDSASNFKAGFILVGDETEGYSEAHINGIKAAAKKLGIPEANLMWKKKVEENEAVTTAGKDLIANGASLVISNSYGHQDYMKDLADSYPDQQFVSMTGDYAAISGASNFKNAFTNIYEARYVSGIVGGMKLKELIDAGTITADDAKVGYVGAYSYAEVVSGYTAFFLGVRSIVPTATMEVIYTNSWFDVTKEANTAETLVNDGCHLIGQHADSTGAPSKCEDMLKAGKICYSVGYNVDMRSVAPNAALTSATNNWEVYYEYAMKSAMNGNVIATDWSKGYADGAVGITDLGNQAAKGTDAAVKAAEDALKAGTLHVFDTSKFTVDGEVVTSKMFDLSYKDWAKGGDEIYHGNTVETVKKDGDVSYIEESVARSAPYFDLRIDGITEKK